jgi:hypothetical protein
MLQETMVSSSQYLEMAWRGKLVFTPGTGNSKGCATLINADSDVSAIKHYENRGHSFKVKFGSEEQLMVCNIYASIGFDLIKTEFLHKVFQDLEVWDGSLVLAGDFNTTLNPDERHCRGVTGTEVRVGELIKAYCTDQNLNDCWEGRAGFT